MPFLRWFAIVCLLCAPAARAQSAGFEREHQAAKAELLPRLNELARWANDNELFAERDRVWRCVLSFESENAQARKGLRYGRSTDGAWIEPAPREMKNRNQKALAELPLQREFAVAKFRSAMSALLAREQASRQLRRAIDAEILAVDPDDVLIRTRRGEKKQGDEWLLAESVCAKERGPQIRAFAAKALSDAPVPQALTPDAEELALGVPWSSGFSIGDVRVLSTGSQDEAVRVASLSYAAGGFFRSVFECTTKHEPRSTIHLLTHGDEQVTYLKNLPGVRPDFREFLNHVVGASIPGRPLIVYWESRLNYRIDGATRQTIGDFLGRTFGIGFDNGWAWEGFGLTLTDALTGTRLTWFIQMEGDGPYSGLRARLMKPETNWIEEALRLLNGPTHPRFEALIEHDVNAMGIADMLYAYAFALYMLEGRPNETPELLRQIGTKGHTTAAAIESVLHSDATELEERIYRWLSVRR